MNPNFYTMAQVSGTVGGLVTGRLCAVVTGNWLESAGLTIVTTTISFCLPLLYKWVLKKINGKDGI